MCWLELVLGGQARSPLLASHTLRVRMADRNSVSAGPPHELRLQVSLALVTRIYIFDCEVGASLLRRLILDRRANGVPHRMNGVISCVRPPHRRVAIILLGGVVDIRAFLRATSPLSRICFVGRSSFLASSFVGWLLLLILGEVVLVLDEVARTLVLLMFADHSTQPRAQITILKVGAQCVKLGHVHGHLRGVCHLLKLPNKL